VPKYEFMCESCKKGFEVVLTVAKKGRPRRPRTI